MADPVLVERYDINLDEAAVGVPVLPGVPDGQDHRERRAAVLAALEREVYGRGPGVDAVVVREEDVTRDALPGTGGVLRQSRLVLARGGSEHALELALVLPAGTTRAVVLAPTFFGNHAALAHPGVRLPRGWVPPREGITDGDRAGDRDRGSDASAWPLEAILGRGTALALVYAGDIDPDDVARRQESVVATLGLPVDDEAPMGTIGTWAWGLRLVARHLRGLDEVTTAPVVALGHSRMGKAALWAAAQDETFAAVVSNQSGCGGASLFRRRYGENIAAITDRFPHWFTPALAGFAGREDELAVDQHLLLAACAPRPVCVTSAIGDPWSDPTGEHAAVVAALPLHREAGGGAIGYHLRPGPHSLTAQDWAHQLAFLEANLL